MAGIVVIVGPTAVGKSRLALQLAERFGAAILSADSRQVYRYMDIGTAKATPAERAAVPHYMLDLVEPSDVYSAGRFAAEGERVLARLRVEGQPALVVGGTGFYVRALLQGLALPPVPPHPGLREKLLAEARSEGSAALHARLREADPLAAERIHPANVARVVRALEIVTVLGGPVPAVAAPADKREALYIGLTMDRALLREVSDRRVLAQIEAGLAEETRQLLAMGYDPASPALSGFGYRQMVAFLEGTCSREEAIRSYQVATHQYIRRQMTWFRSDPRVRWLDATNAQQAAQSMVKEWFSANG